MVKPNNDAIILVGVACEPAKVRPVLSGAIYPCWWMRLERAVGGDQKVGTRHRF